MKKNRASFIVTITLLAVAVYLIGTQRKGTIREELKNFAVQDTASITKIFMADKSGGASTLVRQSAGKWLVNGKYVARKEVIDILLYTVKAMEVRSPVAKAAYNVIMKQIAATGIKVEIYQNDKLAKTFYVGGSTDDLLGTYMYMENSSVPFVIHIPGFDGYLSTRFITDENQWKLRNVFDKKPEEITSFISEDLAHPENSFIISKQPSGEFILATYPAKIPVPDVEENKVMNFLSDFNAVNYERESNYKKEFTDSIKEAGPFRILTLTDNTNKPKKITFFRMPVSDQNKKYLDPAIALNLTYDKDRMLALVDDEPGFILVQYYVFDKFFRAPNDFRLIRNLNAKK